MSEEEELLNKLKDCAKRITHDPEIYHSEADDAIIMYFTKKGYARIASQYRFITNRSWYA